MKSFGPILELKVFYPRDGYGTELFRQTDFCPGPGLECRDRCPDAILKFLLPWFEPWSTGYKYIFNFTVKTSFSKRG